MFDSYLQTVHIDQEAGGWNSSTRTIVKHGEKSLLPTKSGTPLR